MRQSPSGGFFPYTLGKFPHYSNPPTNSTPTQVPATSDIHVTVACAGSRPGDLVIINPIAIGLGGFPTEAGYLTLQAAAGHDVITVWLGNQSASAVNLADDFNFAAMVLPSDR